MRYLQVVTVLLLLLNVTNATHFRFASISWEQIPGGNGRLVRFTIEMAWRRTFFNNGNFDVGDMVTEPSRFFPDENENDNTQLEMTVNVINEASDYFIGVFVYEHEYEEDGVYIASFERGDRISTLINNPDGRFRVSTQLVVETGVTRQSITTTTTPIQIAVIDEPISAQIVAVPGANEVLTYRFANAAEAASGFTYNQIDGLSIDSDTGVMQWTPSQEGLYSTQVVIEGRDNPRSRNPDTFVVVDFIFSVIQDTGMQCSCTCLNGGDPCVSDFDCFQCETNGFTTPPPTCFANSPPSFTSVTANGVQLDVMSSISTTAIAGQVFELVIAATDPNPDDFVSISSTAIPSAATVDIVEDNPGTSTLRYTPVDEDDGFLICFTATDCAFNTAPGQVCVAVSVDEGAFSAAGEGLTFTVAGRETSFNIMNAAGRDHSVDIIGNDQSAIAVVTEVSSGNYIATYNIDGNSNTDVTVSGFYALSITDDTAGRSLAFSLLCVPAETSPVDAKLFDQGSTGLTGGSSGSTVMFLIQSRDEFENDVIETIGGRTLEAPLGPSNDAYSAQVLFGSNPNNQQEIDFAQATHIGEGLFTVEYTLPEVTEDDSYTLEVTHTNTSTGETTIVDTLTLPVFANDFTAQIVDLPSTIIAGEVFTFNIQASDNMTHDFTVFVRDVQATVGTAVNGLHPVTAEPVTLADTFINQDGINAFAPGLQGITQASFIVSPAAPSGPNCIIDEGSDGLFEAEAGEIAMFIVQLFDEFDNAITDDVEDINVAISGSLTETRQMTFDDGEYTFEYTPIDAVEITIELTLSTSGEAVANSPYTFTVDAGEFSFSQSSFTGVVPLDAGQSITVRVAAHDAFRNPRLPGEDNFQATLELSDENGAQTFGTTSVGSAIDENEYFVTLSATVRGVYQLEVDVFVPRESGFLEFLEIPVTVNPGPIDPSNGFITGEGLDGGVEGEEALVLMQSRDLFDNVIGDRGDDFYLVQVQGPQGTTFYAAGYTLPGGVEDENNFNIDLHTRFTGLQDADNNLSPEEEALADDGFWRVGYVVPDSSSDPYNITVSYVNASMIDANMTGEEILALPGTIMLTNTQAMASPRGDGGIGDISAFDDDWELIAISVGAGAAFLSLVGYGGWRLQRYRPKYLAQRRRADSAEQALADMGAEIDVIQGGRDFEAVGAATVLANPLHPAYHLKHKPSEQIEQLEAPSDALAPQKARGAFRKELAPSSFHRLEADLDSDEE